MTSRHSNVSNVSVPNSAGVQAQSARKNTRSSNGTLPVAKVPLTNRFNPLHRTKAVHVATKSPAAALNPNFFLNDAGVQLDLGFQEAHEEGNSSSNEQLDDQSHSQLLSNRRLPTRDVGPTENDDDDLPGIDGIMIPFAPIRTLDDVPRGVNELRGLLQFDETHSELVNRLLIAKPEEQWGMTVLLMVANLNKVGLGRVSIPQVPNNAPVTHAHSFSTTIRCFLRKKIRKILTIGNVDAYTRTHTTQGLPITRTPLVLLTTYLDAQPKPFKDDYLPLGWPKNHLSSQSVLALLRILLKHERGALRNLLLTNIKGFNRQPINGPVPRLMDLILIIDRAMGTKHELCGVQAIRASYPDSMKIRIAYLRLEVVFHFLHPDPTSNLTQWDIIDQNLEHLQNQSHNYKHAYARLIVQTNDAIFGQLDFAEIPKEEIRLPTEEEVEDEISKGNLNPREAEDNKEALVITGAEFE
ncbi:hypothetical protein PCASD_18573 [Puccinia coronata f. sp. avenae]|uniref:Uncharacterized protein n=1 Tax=Puccinia coronata f. sp. avenae TaxID=200324 RepID=A0A2N5TT38_9BASI|nr:hypothetical protein PCASD_18573 [Puccinia coronata f. sp. avenae]